MSPKEKLNEDKKMREESTNQNSENIKQEAGKKKSSNRKNSRYRKSKSKDTNDSTNTKDDKTTLQKTDVTNDPAWYTKDPMYAASVSKLLYSKPTGDPLPPIFGTAGSSSTIKSKDEYRLESGIMIFEDMATWGGVDNEYPFGYIPDDIPGQALTLNIVGAKIMQFMQTFNSRSYTYQKSDVLKYVMCVDQLGMLLFEAARAYKYAYAISTFNRYDSHIITALGWVKDDVIKNLASFKSLITYYTSLFNRLYVPALFSIVPAHFQHYSNVYLDQQDTKGQMYAFIPHGFWYYSAKMGSLNYVQSMVTDYIPSTETVGRSYLNTLEWRPGYRTVANWEKLFQNLFQTVYSDETFAKIQSDLLRSFGISSLGSLVLDLDSPALPVYDMEENYKLHNARMLSDFEEQFFRRVTSDGTNRDWHWVSRNSNAPDVDGFCYTYYDDGLEQGAPKYVTPSSMIYRDSTTRDGDIICLVGSCFHPTYTISYTEDQVPSRHNTPNGGTVASNFYNGYNNEWGARYFDRPAGTESDTTSMLLQHVYDHVVNYGTRSEQWDPGIGEYTTSKRERYTAATSSFVLGPGTLFILGQPTAMKPNVPAELEQFGNSLYYQIQNYNLYTPLYYLYSGTAYRSMQEASLGHFRNFSNLPIIYIASDYVHFVKYGDTTDLIYEDSDDQKKILRSIVISLLTVSIPGGGTSSSKVDAKYQPRH